MHASDLTVAVRAYATAERAKPQGRQAPYRRGHAWRRPVLVFDTETTTDPTQRLRFGSYRYHRWTTRGTLRCVEESLFYADDLPETDPDALAALQEYVATHAAQVANDCDPQLPLYSRRAFVQRVFWRAAYRGRALVVGFNLPFDLSRIAVDVGTARGRFHGGFSFVLWDAWNEASGTYMENRFRPRVGIKHLDSARAFIGFTGRLTVRPGDGESAKKSVPSGAFSGHFLDLRTLAFALTNERHSLRSACEAFGVAHGKATIEAHGTVTPEYIDYNRQDVAASVELLEKLRAEFDKHPIRLDPCKAFSPASLAKAYLTGMGVSPR